MRGKTTHLYIKDWHESSPTTWPLLSWNVSHDIEYHKKISGENVSTSCPANDKSVFRRRDLQMEGNKQHLRKVAAVWFIEMIKSAMWERPQTAAADWCFSTKVSAAWSKAQQKRLDSQNKWNPVYWQKTAIERGSTADNKAHGSYGTKNKLLFWLYTVVWGLSFTWPEDHMLRVKESTFEG